ncbi:MAG: molecular chaperone Hsp33 [Geobacteraceae bacterium GWC2_55_20]|nr:MAG: molecular chaperone Hsp33 [Geobacteraceae bacterium GWC2_55_20]OGU21947.1 MAG: molecular chaperone Hsp33 [Geobacteraceae bacterium GWF2_54_21]HCE67920.1 Hsp33 family molecular chaperone HslO [Geobacter sp.]
MSDRMVRALCLSGGIRVLACDATVLAREICLLQETSATASIAMGRGLAGGALLGALLKSGQRIALKFEGNGPLIKLLIEADSDGAVCGCAGNPAAEVEPQNGRWNVAGLIGKAGFLTVSKDIGVGGQPYQGLVQLVSSEIGDDLAYYLTESEQTPSAVGLGAALDDNGRIEVCGGFLVQALPKADQSELEKIMERISSAPPLSSMLSEGGPEGIIRELFGDIPYTVLETHDIFFRCGCSLDKVERALITMGTKELTDMQADDEGAVVTCEFCRKTYRFDRECLGQLINRAADKPDR